MASEENVSSRRHSGGRISVDDVDALFRMAFHSLNQPIEASTPVLGAEPTEITPAPALSVPTAQTAISRLPTGNPRAARSRSAKTTSFVPTGDQRRRPASGVKNDAEGGHLLTNDRQSRTHVATTNSTSIVRERTRELVQTFATLLVLVLRTLAVILISLLGTILLILIIVLRTALNVLKFLLPTIAATPLNLWNRAIYGGMAVGPSLMPANQAENVTVDELADHMLAASSLIARLEHSPDNLAERRRALAELRDMAMMLVDQFETDDETDTLAPGATSRASHPNALESCIGWCAVDENSTTNQNRDRASIDRSVP
jgi:hypothetical protein